MKLHKYQALGNDYLVLDAYTHPEKPSSTSVKKICDRHYGVGSDGLLYGSSISDNNQYDLCIFNPDGSEAEKSGNGLRIFARYLFEQHSFTIQSLQIKTASGVSQATIDLKSELITIQMGKPSFLSNEIPLLSSTSSSLNQSIIINSEKLTFHAVNVGNPHCVIPLSHISASYVQYIGPLFENDTIFPNKTNVQLLEVIDNHTIKIEIWERGAGYTLSSGSSACACAAISYQLGYCTSPIHVYMKGGNLRVDIQPDFQISLQGPVKKIAIVELETSF